MMSIPFFAAGLAIAAGWCGLRGGAAVLAVVAVGATLVLFAQHATSSIDIAL